MLERQAEDFGFGRFMTNNSAVSMVFMDVGTSAGLPPVTPAEPKDVGVA